MSVCVYPCVCVCVCVWVCVACLPATATRLTKQEIHIGPVPVGTLGFGAGLGHAVPGVFRMEMTGGSGGDHL